MITTEFFDTLTQYNESINQMAYATQEVQIVEAPEESDEIETESLEVIEEPEPETVEDDEVVE